MWDWIAKSSFFMSVVAIAGAMGLLYAGLQVPGEAVAINSVSMGDNFFQPQSINVSVGQAVEWKNDGQLPHTATASTGSFDSGLVMKTKTFSQLFEAPGTFSYACAVHPEMVGTVVVAGAAQATPAPTAAPPAAPVVAPGAAPVNPAPVAQVNVNAPAAGTLPVGGGMPMPTGMAQGAIALVIAGILFAAMGGGAMAMAARSSREVI